jgi:phage shock protein PspC (stress-responsive transcriptional regulator)
MNAKPKFMGVCSFLANKYNVDVTLLRLATLVGIIMTGVVPGILVYFVASFIIDD